MKFPLIQRTIATAGRRPFPSRSAKVRLQHWDPLLEDPALRDRESRQCTIRNIIVGSFFGLIIGAANIYTGLKIGCGLSAGTFAVFCGFAVLKAMQRLPSNWGGGYFGPKENVSCQSAANGACSGASIFVLAYPRHYANDN